MVTEMVDKWINYNRKRSAYSLLARKDFKKRFLIGLRIRVRGRTRIRYETKNAVKIEM